MPIVKKYFPQTESELHIVIQRELDAIEDGLVLLQHEYPTGKGLVDFLCVDSGGTLVIVEVKLREDENVLFQALRYFSEIDKNRYLVATVFPDKHINPNEPPRIVLIAEKFSEDIRRLSTLVVPEIELLEYSALALPGGEKSILFHSVSLPLSPRPPAEPKTVEKLIEYLKEDNLKPTIANMRQAIKSMGKGIEEYATQGYIGYKHATGRQFAYIKVYRTSIGLGTYIIDEKKQILESKETRVETGEEDYSEILEKIKSALVNLGSKGGD